MIERSEGGAISRPDCTIGKIPSTGVTSPTPVFYKNFVLSAPPGPDTMIGNTVPPTAGRFGTCGLGNLEGPGMIDVDAGLAKRFNIGERMHLRFEASFTNVINHTNYAPPSMNVGEPSTFGVLNSALLQGEGGNRTGQVAARFDF